ncbi:MAG: CGNR zinc finger domain-containing protein [Actinomycetota bacterium]
MTDIIGVVLTSVTQSEIRLTLEAVVALHNQFRNEDVDTRVALADRGFARAARASDASIHRLERRILELHDLLQSLPELDVDEAIAQVNEVLTELAISPSVQAHDGVGPHLHWTPSTARFDEQVLADITMALAFELCDNGVDRFGHCSASDCQDLFYDATRNRSRRFCDDPKCANRTHAADHRARRRTS